MGTSIIRRCWPLLLALVLAHPALADQRTRSVDELIAAHPGQTGAMVLERGEDALQARAWLADRAQTSIDVQYFIWSTDNIGILAAEALLRAAERGVRVRVIVDDLLIDAPDKSLLALARHPNIEIRIYNPKHSVGTPLHKRLLNVAVDFRGVNQRMHDKTFTVDGKVAITGGRNMAAEYFDYNHAFNFRDRDVLLLGTAVRDLHESFERFWQSPLAVTVEDRFDGLGLFQKRLTIDDGAVAGIYRDLHAYAAAPENFAPQVRAAIEAGPEKMRAMADELVWGPVRFISDVPGKNERRFGLGGGGQTSTALAKLAASAQERIVIQSPYLILSDAAMELFAKAIARGVKVRISTNSLAATDNLQAFSGYRKQRARLLRMGLEIHEFRPDPDLRHRLMLPATEAAEPPIFSLHAKTMVVDGKTLYVGTYNLDPRSENLNTEVGVVIDNPAVAGRVEAAIETDMAPGNSWSAATDDPDQYAPLGKRGQVGLWRLLPLTPLL